MDKKLVRGQVIENLPNSLCRVVLEENGREILCYLAGKLKLNKIKCLVGDKVSILLDPYGGKATNRIVERLKQ